MGITFPLNVCNSKKREIMKKIILLILLAVCTVQANAQQHLRGTYYTLEDCHLDPLLYIEQNYIHNVARHVGRTVQDWAQTEFELNVEPSQISPSIYVAGIIGGNDVTQNGNCIGIVLDFHYKIEYNDEVADAQYSVVIEFVEPSNQNVNDPASPIYRFSDAEVTWQQYLDMFGSNRIEMIWVYKKINGKHVTKTYERTREYL